MAKYITFERRSNFIYFILLFTFYMVRKFVTFFLGNYCGYSNRTFIILLMFMSEFFGGLFWFLYEKNSFNKEFVTQEHFTSLFNLNLINQNLDNDKTKVKKNYIKIGLLVFLLTIFDLSSGIVPCNLRNITIYGQAGTIDETFFNVTYFLSETILCYFLLSIKLYKHNLVSIGICLTCYIIIIIFDVVLDKFSFKKPIESLIYFGVNFLCNFTYAFVPILEKYLMEKQSAKPPFIVCLSGAIGTILTLILNFLIIPAFKLENIPKISFPKIGERYRIFLLVLALFLYFILSAGANIYLAQTLNYFSPLAHVVIIAISYPFFLIYYFFIQEIVIANFFLAPWYYILSIILSFLVAFFSLVYNEFIIINICGMNKNTFLQIRERSEVELNTMVNGNVLGSEINSLNDSRDSLDYNIISIEEKGPDSSF